jgi:hypothetical protein
MRVMCTYAIRTEWTISLRDSDENPGEKEALRRIVTRLTQIQTDGRLTPNRWWTIHTMSDGV